MIKESTRDIESTDIRQEIIEEKFVPKVGVECQRIEPGWDYWSKKTYTSLEEIFFDWRQGHRFAPTDAYAKEIVSIREKKWLPKKGDTFVMGIPPNEVQSGEAHENFKFSASPIAPSYGQLLVLGKHIGA